ncbi:MAG: LPS export ABC transporter periplasmic protein LptC [Pseudomonadota bacterium]|nr:LPS export ABC transporter periplasmic protein LptC [Pseudomonadota bacterium]
MLTLRQLILALIMAAGGALAWWHLPDEESAPVREVDLERKPDYTVDNFTATMMGETGTPHRRLSARELRHYPDDESSELEQPMLTLFNEEGPPWLVRSQTGWVSADGDRLVLRGQVLIKREAGERTRPLELQTAELQVQPRNKYAETDQPVRATSEADWLTSANGARIWFGDPVRVKLLGRARGEFVVP